MGTRAHGEAPTLRSHVRGSDGEFWADDARVLAYSPGATGTLLGDWAASGSTRTTPWYAGRPAARWQQIELSGDD